MCGIAGIVELRPGAPPPDREALVAHGRRRSVTAVPTSTASTATSALASPTRACRSSTCPRASSRCRTKTARCGSSSTARSSTTSSCARSSRRRGHRFRTRSDTEVIVARLGGVGRGRPARASTASGRFALWDASARAPRAGARPGRHPAAVRLRARRAPVLRERGEGHLRRRPRHPARARPGGARSRSSPSGAWCRRRPCSAASRRLRPGSCAWCEADGRRASTPTGSRGIRKGTRETGPSAGAWRRRRRRCAMRCGRRRLCACCAPTCPWAATSRAGSTAPWWRPSGARPSGERFHTFSIRFEDAEYDETRYQQMMVARLGSEHHEIVVSRRDIAEAFPKAVLHAERPVLRTAPAPLFLLSHLVRETGIKVVLTGEGADEMFAGYDLFREGEVRRFWARQPGSVMRPRLLERLYPYLTRSPVAQQAMARQFFGRNLDRYGDARLRARPALARRLRARAPVLGGDARRASSGRDAGGRAASPRCPSASRVGRGSPSDQYLEVRTLLPGYLLSLAGRPHADGALGGGALPLPRPGRGGARRLAAAELQAARARREARAQARGARPRAPRRSWRARSSPTARPTPSPSSGPARPNGSRTGSTPPRWPMRASSIRARSPSSGSKSGARRTAASSRTPTTWPSSACCRPSYCTRRSCATPRRPPHR